MIRFLTFHNGAMFDIATRIMSLLSAHPTIDWIKIIKHEVFGSPRTVEMLKLQLERGKICGGRLLHLLIDKIAHIDNDVERQAMMQPLEQFGLLQAFANHVKMLPKGSYSDDSSDSDDSTISRRNKLKWHYWIFHIVRLLVRIPPTHGVNHQNYLLNSPWQAATMNLMVRTNILSTFLTCTEFVWSYDDEDEDIMEIRDIYVPKQASEIIVRIVQIAACINDQQANEVCCIQWLVNNAKIGSTIARMLISLEHVDEIWFGDIIAEYELVQTRMSHVLILIVRQLGGLITEAGMEFACTFVRNEKAIDVLKTILSFLHNIQHVHGNGDTEFLVDPDLGRIDGWTWDSIDDETPTKFLQDDGSIAELLSKLDKCENAWNDFHGGEGIFVYDVNCIISAGKITCSILRELIVTEKEEVARYMA